jgi:hypothetical protein
MKKLRNRLVDTLMKTDISFSSFQVVFRIQISKEVL